MSLGGVIAGVLVGVACAILIMLLLIFLVYKRSRAARRRKAQLWVRTLELRQELRRALAIQPLLVLDPLQPPPAGSERTALQPADGTTAVAEAAAPLPIATGQIILVGNNAEQSLEAVQQRMSSVFIDEELLHEYYAKDQVDEATGAISSSDEGNSKFLDNHSSLSAPPPALQRHTPPTATTSTTSMATMIPVPSNFSHFEDKNCIVVHLSCEAAQPDSGLSGSEDTVKVFRRQTSEARYGTAEYYNAPTSPVAAGAITTVGAAALSPTTAITKIRVEPVAETDDDTKQ